MGLTPIMRLLTFFGVLSLVAASYAVGVCNDHLDDCSIVKDIVLIECDSDALPFTSSTTTLAPNETSRAEDKCKADRAGFDYLLGTGDSKIQSIDQDLCRKMCKIEYRHDDGGQCKFHRWGYNREANKYYCSLQTECFNEGEEDEWTPNNPNGCMDKEHCESGQIACYRNKTEIKDCTIPAKIEYVPDGFHIVCEDVDLLDINLYSDKFVEPNTVPGDPVCRTTRKCAEWHDHDNDLDNPYRRKSAIKCDGTAGEWITADNSGNPDAKEDMLDGDQVKEPDCPTKCKDLPLTKYTEQYWADLICDPPLGEDHKLKDNDVYTNSCILTCDFHFKMTIDCNFMKDGEKEWTDNHGKIVTDQDVQCD